MDPRFDIYNTHLTKGVKHFLRHDPQLSRLQHLAYAYTFPLLNELPTMESGIYTLGGGRQIGKSTLLKQWMAYLMTEKSIQPQQIAYITGDIIDDYHQLMQQVSNILQQMDGAQLRFLVIDEVTYIDGWERGIKFLADTGQLHEVIVILSGSDLGMMKDARIQFPGRRGSAQKVDFHLYPLSFYEYLMLVKNELAQSLDAQQTEQQQQKLIDAFQNYLQHGGYLTAINDIATFNSIQPATFAIYSDWIRGDVLKRRKGENTLKELLRGVLKHMSSQVTWTKLAQSLSIAHHQTIADYVDILEKMDALFVQYALQEDKLMAAPKKARKTFFSDPFVAHAIRAWLEPVASPYELQVLPLFQTPKAVAELVELVVVNHFKRYYQTYYIKADGEVDVAYVNKGKFWPIEIKWRNQIHAHELKQIQKYKNGCIWGKTRYEVNGVRSYFLPLALAQLGRDGCWEPGIE